MFSSLPRGRRIILSAAVALAFGLGTVSLFASGFSSDPLVKLAQFVAVLGSGVVIIGGAAGLAAVRLGGWSEPESELDFEELVQRSEQLAATARMEEAPTGALENGQDDPFRRLVRAAVDELPLEFHRALEHVAIVISDGGAERRAYGLYQGDTIAQDYFHERIVIFRDTLLRDFGHDPELLTRQVTRVVRHELAHHLGWDEQGVRGLGL